MPGVDQTSGKHDLVAAFYATQSDQAGFKITKPACSAAEMFE